MNATPETKKGKTTRGLENYEVEEETEKTINKLKSNGQYEVGAGQDPAN